MEITLKSTEQFTFGKYGEGNDVHMGYLSFQINPTFGTYDLGHRYTSKLLMTLFPHKKKRDIKEITEDLAVQAKVFMEINTSNKTSRMFISADKIEENSLLSRLDDVFGLNALRFDTEFNFDIAQGHKISIKDASIIDLNTHFTFVCHFEVDDTLKSMWLESSEIKGSGSITIKLDHEMLDCLRLRDLKHLLKTNRKIWMESIASDAIIIAGNGSEIKCHKAFLSAESPVFCAMLETKMQEGINNTVKIPDMSEASVRALLAFLYCWEIQEASKCCTVALELLIAGEKYNIVKLEKEVLNLMLSKKNEWFTVKVALGLLKFAQSKADQTAYRLIEEMATAVLKSKSADELLSCSEYRNLFGNEEAGVNFCTYMITSENEPKVIDQFLKGQLENQTSKDE